MFRQQSCNTWAVHCGNMTVCKSLWFICVPSGLFCNSCRSFQRFSLTSFDNNLNLVNKDSETSWIRHFIFLSFIFPFLPWLHDRPHTAFRTHWSFSCSSDYCRALMKFALRQHHYSFQQGQKRKKKKNLLTASTSMRETITARVVYNDKWGLSPNCLPEIAMFAICYIIMWLQTMEWNILCS